MNLVKEHFEENEIIENEYTFSRGATVKNFLISNLIYIIMWVALLVTSIYFFVKLKTVSADYWFVIITPVGFVVLRIWTLVFNYFSKIFAENKETGYILTNRAIYYYNDGIYKSVKKIAFEDIVAVEKSEFIADGFYIASKQDVIHVCNIKDENNLFVKMVEKIKQ